MGSVTLLLRMEERCIKCRVLRNWESRALRVLAEKALGGALLADATLEWADGSCVDGCASVASVVESAPSFARNIRDGFLEIEIWTLTQPKPSYHNSRKLAKKLTVDEQLARLYAPTRDATEQQRELGMRGTLPSGRRRGSGDTDDTQEADFEGWERFESALALGGSTAEERLETRLFPVVHSLSARLWFDFTEPRARDVSWVRSFETGITEAVRLAMRAYTQRLQRVEGKLKQNGFKLDLFSNGTTKCEEPRVLVLGLHAGVAALVAAVAGAKVVWIERVRRHAEVAKRIIAANNMEDRVEIATAARGAPYTSLSLKSKRGAGFDVVVTEFFDANKADGGLTELAKAAYEHQWLRPKSGVFLPRRVIYKVAAAELSTKNSKAFNGLDLQLFDRFRDAHRATYDLVDELGADAHHALLSASTSIFVGEVSRVALLGDSSEAPPANRIVSRRTAHRAGSLTAVVGWHRIVFSESVSTGFGPVDVSRNLKPFCRDGVLRPWLQNCEQVDRALKQTVRYLRSPRLVEAGDILELILVLDHSKVLIDLEAAIVPPTGELGCSMFRKPTLALNLIGNLTFATRPLLPYHWPMIADEQRNACYNCALKLAINRILETQSTCDVLDIGAGSGLLAMMAARAGATSVTSVEMVPALAEASATIIAANGFGDVVRVLARKSNDISVSNTTTTRRSLAETRRDAPFQRQAFLLRKVDILVSEILDNGLLGEGVVPTTQDARTRLLKPGGVIIPRAAALYAILIEYKVPPTPLYGFDRTDLEVFYTDASAGTAAPAKSIMLQRHAHKKLSTPVKLFDFDFYSASFEENIIAAEVACEITVLQTGTLTCVCLFFDLDLYAGAPKFSTSPNNPNLVAWDQTLRYLPIQLGVHRGQVLKLTANHDNLHVHVGLPSVDGCVLGLGHRELLNKRTTNEPTSIC